MSTPANVRTVKALEHRPLGKSEVEVSVLGLGGAPLGNLFEIVPEDRALATIAEAFEAGITWFDTAPLYGHGVSEHRFGHVLRQRPRATFTLSTKVGRLLRTTGDVGPSPFKGHHGFAIVHDYGYGATMRSIEDSWQRLGMNRIDVALIHDVDRMHAGEGYEARLAEAVGGACRALAELKATGVIGAWGIGVNEIEPCLAFGRETDLDCVMVARSFTLLEQEGVPELLLLAKQRGFSMLVAGPFASGVLAAETPAKATHNYAPTAPAALERVGRLTAVCAGNHVPLKAAALRFPLLYPEVAAVCAGAVAPEQAMENARLMRDPIPDDLWAELRHEGLVDPQLGRPGPVSG